MTARQRQFFDFIRSYAERHGTSPSYAQIGESFNVSKQAAVQAIRALERHGVLRKPFGSRRIELVQNRAA